MTCSDINYLRDLAKDRTTYATQAFVRAWDEVGIINDYGPITRIYLEIQNNRGRHSNNTIRIPSKYKDAFLRELKKESDIAEIKVDDVKIDLEKIDLEINDLTPEYIAKTVREYPQGCSDQKEEFLKALLGEGNVPSFPRKKAVITVEVELTEYGTIAGIPQNWNTKAWNDEFRSALKFVSRDKVFGENTVTNVEYKDV
jgi:ribosomal protein S8